MGGGALPPSTGPTDSPYTRLPVSSLHCSPHGCRQLLGFQCGGCEPNGTYKKGLQAPLGLFWVYGDLTAA